VKRRFAEVLYSANIATLPGRKAVEKRLNVDRFRKLLLAEKKRLLEERESVDRELAEKGGDSSDYDYYDPSDSATEAVEYSKDFAIEENVRDILQRIDEALRKIDEGSYGICDRCENPIHTDRLRALPYATLCIECQERMER
jgi:DnaK suppressor protein